MTTPRLLVFYCGYQARNRRAMHTYHATTAWVGSSRCLLTSETSPWLHDAEVVPFHGRRNRVRRLAFYPDPYSTTPLPTAALSLQPARPHGPHPTTMPFRGNPLLAHASDDAPSLKDLADLLQYHIHYTDDMAQVPGRSGSLGGMALSSEDHYAMQIFVHTNNHMNVGYLQA